MKNGQSTPFRSGTMPGSPTITLLLYSLHNGKGPAHGHRINYQPSQQTKAVHLVDQCLTPLTRVLS